MEFVGEKCYLCGEQFGNSKPESATEVEPFPFEDYRLVTVVGPCPSCGEDVPLWAGTGDMSDVPPVEPTEPAEEPTEPAEEPTEPTEPSEPEA